MTRDNTLMSVGMAIFGLAQGLFAESRGVDWLVTAVKTPAAVERSKDGREIVLSNGLIRRTFRLQPNAATVA